MGKIVVVAAILVAVVVLAPELVVMAAELGSAVELAALNDIIGYSNKGRGLYTVKAVIDEVGKVITVFPK